MRKIHPLYPHTYKATVIKDIDGCFGCSAFKTGEVVECIIVENASEPDVYLVEFKSIRGQRQNSVDLINIKEYLKCNGIVSYNGAERLQENLISLWNDAMR
jgi:hypothetical protein